MTTHTVLHNLIFGCLLVFLIQWIFLGDLRSAIIVGANIPFALFFAIIILVLQGEDANLLSLGAVDFGIIVDSAVIMMENIFRNFQSRPTRIGKTLLEHLAEGYWGADPTSAQPDTTSAKKWTERLRLIFVSALQVDKAVLFSAAITVAAFVPLFTMQGVEGQIFGPMARTYGYALAGALIATFTVTPVLASLLLPEADRGDRDHHRPCPARRSIRRCCAGRSTHRGICRHGGSGVSRAQRACWRPGSAANSCRRWRRAISGSGRRCRRRCPLMRAPRRRARCAKSCCGIRRSSPWCRSTAVPTMAAMPRRSPTSSCSRRSSRSTNGRPDLTKEKLTEELQKEFSEELPGVGFNFSQYIQDNVEEAMSGVKGANSVKIIGPNLETLEKLATQVMAEMDQGPGRRRPRHISRARAAQSQHQDRSRKSRPLRSQYRRRQYRGSGGAGRHRRDNGPGGRPAVQSGGPAGPESTATASRRSANVKVGYQTPSAPTPIFR